MNYVVHALSEQNSTKSKCCTQFSNKIRTPIDNICVTIKNNTMLKPHLIDHVKPYMTKPITNAEEAVRFICALYLDHNMFHFETHPEDCVTVIYKEPGKKAVTQPSFTKAQIMHLNRRRLELFDHLEDPFILPLCILEQAKQM